MTWLKCFYFSVSIDMANQDQDLRSAVTEAATCAICLGLYNRPKRYGTCPHVFCLDCIRGHVRAQQQNYPPCPVCRRPSILRSIAEINTLQLGITEEMIVDCLNKPSIQKICEKHGGQTKDLLCIMCQNVMCSHCERFFHAECEKKWFHYQVSERYRTPFLQLYTESNENRKAFKKYNKTIVPLDDFLSEARKWFKHVYGEVKSSLDFFTKYRQVLQSIVITPQSDSLASKRAEHIQEEMDNILQYGKDICSDIDQIMSSSASDVESAKHVLNIDMKTSSGRFGRCKEKFAIEIRPIALRMENQGILKQVSTCLLQENNCCFAGTVHLVEHDSLASKMCVPIEDVICSGNVPSALNAHIVNGKRMIPVYNRLFSIFLQTSECVTESFSEYTKIATITPYKYGFTKYGCSSEVISNSTFSANTSQGSLDNSIYELTSGFFVMCDNFSSRFHSERDCQSATTRIRSIILQYLVPRMRQAST